MIFPEDDRVLFLAVDIRNNMVRTMRLIHVSYERLYSGALHHSEELVRMSPVVMFAPKRHFIYTYRGALNRAFEGCEAEC